MRSHSLAAEDLHALEKERDTALAALIALDLERAAGELDEDSYRGLRDDHTARAAAAIRAIEAATATPALAATQAATATPATATPAPAALAATPAPAAPAASARRRRRWRPRGGRRWMLVASALAFVVAVGIAVGRLAATRLPGEQVSGNPPVTTPPSKAQLNAQIAAELLQGRTLVSQNNDVAAAKVFAEVLAVDPGEPVALAYEGWVLRLAGVSAHDTADIQNGRALVAEAVALDPSYPDAHVFLGYMFFQDVHNAGEAVAQFKAFLADHPLAALVDRTAPVIDQAYVADHQAVPAQVLAALHPAARH